ncbi:hypothetical protein QBC43DRAFT_94969 [Cladorrhinum sp. PSN259]|nr:hypothetical protein QBC43DRAFT_94969 [Cladorrhinum sp. PSN259]
MIPPYAISCIGDHHVAVRKQDFDRIPDEIFKNPDFQPFDLHDFAHLVATNPCPELYANTYFADFLNLDPSLTALIRSAGMNMATGPRISDGMIFGEILTPLWTKHVKAHTFGQVEYTYESLTATIAKELAEYVLGKRPLRHRSTGKLIKLDEADHTCSTGCFGTNKSIRRDSLGD